MGRVPTIAQAALAIIRDQGPQTMDELVGGVVSAGATRAKDPLRALESAMACHDGFVHGRDGRVYSLSDQLEGVVFTRRLTTLERRYRIVVQGEDLALVTRLIDRYGRRFTGVYEGRFDELFSTSSLDPDLLYSDDTHEALRELPPDLVEELVDFVIQSGVARGRSEEEAVVHFLREGPHHYLSSWAGTLPEAGPRTLFAITVRDGKIDLGVLDRSAAYGPHVFDAASRIAGLAGLIIGACDGSSELPRTMRIEELLEIIVTEQPDILRHPLPPLVEVFELSGLEVDDGWVALRAAAEEESEVSAIAA